MVSVSPPPFSVTGAGPALVLIAGFGQSGVVWDSVLPRLSRNFTCYVFDNRGAGTRTGETRGLTVEAMAEDVAAIIRATATGRAAVLGWSMGGVVAQRVALQHPDLVDSMVLISTMAWRTPLQEQWAAAQIALARTEDCGAAAVTAGLAWLFTPALLADHTRAMAIADARSQSEVADAAALEAQSRALDGFDHRSELGGVACPSLVLVGADDVLTPVPMAIELARLLPDAELEILHHGGHGAVVEMPSSVFPPVIRFLKSSEHRTTTSPRRGHAVPTGTRS